MKPVPSTRLLLSCAIAASLHVCTLAHAGAVESTFASSAEGWTNVTLPYPYAGSPPQVLFSFTPTFVAAGGNPRGHITLFDPNPNTQYWRAPAAFLGAQSDKLHGTLVFDLAQQPITSPYEQEDVILVGAGLTLMYDMPGVPAPTWSHFEVRLCPSLWHKDSLSGAAPSEAEMTNVLASLSDLFIRAEFQLGDEIELLDNARLIPSDLTADLNGSGTVNAADLAILLGDWGGEGPSDLNCDGVVNAADLAILLGSWS